MNAVVAFLAGAAVFGVGVVAGRLSSAPKSVPDTFKPTQENVSLADAKSSDLDRAVTRLQQLVDRIDASNAVTPARTEVKSSAGGISAVDLLRDIKDQVAVMVADVRLQTSGLVEAGRLKPGPDLQSLEQLMRETGGDATKLIARISGIDFTDATRAFGTPTVKRSRSSNKVVEWLWDMPDANRALLLEFDGGVSSWGGFVSRDALKQD